MLTSDFKSHLDVATDYEANHWAYASQGITLAGRVNDYFVNDANAPEPTDDILAAVKARSERLNDKWMAGEVPEPANE